MTPRAPLVHITIGPPPATPASPLDVAELPAETAMEKVANALAEVGHVLHRASVAERLDAWAHGSGDLAMELVAAWRAHGTKDEAVHLSTRTGVDGTPIYVVRCANGYHESRESHEHALAQMVDAHRIGIEDLGATRDLVWWASGDRHAAALLEAIAAAVRDDRPELGGTDRDAEVLVRVRAADAEARSENGVTASAEAIEAARIADPVRWATSRMFVVDALPKDPR